MKSRTLTRQRPVAAIIFDTNMTGQDEHTAPTKTQETTSQNPTTTAEPLFHLGKHGQMYQVIRALSAVGVQHVLVGTTNGRTQRRRAENPAHQTDLALYAKQYDITVHFRPIPAPPPTALLRSTAESAIPPASQPAIAQRGSPKNLHSTNNGPAKASLAFLLTGVLPLLDQILPGQTSTPSGPVSAREPRTDPPDTGLQREKAPERTDTLTDTLEEGVFLTFSGILAPPSHYELLATAWQTRQDAILATVVNTGKAGQHTHRDAPVTEWVCFDGKRRMTGSTTDITDSAQQAGATHAGWDGKIGVWSRRALNTLSATYDPTSDATSDMTSIPTSDPQHRDWEQTNGQLGGLEEARRTGLTVGVETLAGPWAEITSPASATAAEAAFAGIIPDIAENLEDFSGDTSRQVTRQVTREATEENL